MATTLGLAAQVTVAGISAPTYAEILAALESSFRGIYGSDIYIAPDSQDGQLLALFAAAINDANDAAIAVYNAFRPSAAVGAGLASVVKVNGISKLVASYSTAVGLVVGQVGKVITNGVVKDDSGFLWNLPASVTIPVAGEILVTVTAQEQGAIEAPAGSINAINNPSLGWQSFVSTVDAVAGAPVESDAALRRRQTVSTSLSANTPLGAMLGALSNLAGVTSVKIYENTTAVADADGIPGKSICVVIRGGDVEAIATTIGQKKTPGAGTYGTTTQSYTDPVTGILYAIEFFILEDVELEIVVTGTALAGYTSTTTDDIKAALAECINSHTTGEDVEYTGLWAPAYLNSPARVQPYRVNALTIAIKGNAQGVLDIAIPFNKIAAIDVADITVTIL